MSRTLVWDGESYRRNKGSYQARGLIRVIAPLSLTALALAALLGASWLASATLLAAAAIVWILTANNNWDLALRRKLNESYYESMRQAIVTKYPHGITYILENVLETLKAFNITALPWQHKFYDVQYGWPNQTLLQEAIDAANYLAEKWPNLDPAEKTMAMTTIRNMIKSEVIYLRGRMEVADTRCPVVQYFGVDTKLKEEMYCRNLYIFSYTQEDHNSALMSRKSSPMPGSIYPGNRLIAGSCNISNIEVLSLSEFTSSHLCTYHEFCVSSRLDNIPDHQKRLLYTEWQETQYESYRRAVGAPIDSTFNQIKPDHHKDATSHQRIQGSAYSDIGFEEFIVQHQQIKYLSKEQQVAEYQTYLQRNGLRDNREPTSDNQEDVW